MYHYYLVASHISAMQRKHNEWQQKQNDKCKTILCFMSFLYKLIRQHIGLKSMGITTRHSVTAMSQIFVKLVTSDTASLNIASQYLHYQLCCSDNHCMHIFLKKYGSLRIIIPHLSVLSSFIYSILIQEHYNNSKQKLQNRTFIKLLLLNKLKTSAISTQT